MIGFLSIAFGAVAAFRFYGSTHPILYWMSVVFTILAFWLVGICHNFAMESAKLKRKHQIENFEKEGRPDVEIGRFTSVILRVKVHQPANREKGSYHSVYRFVKGLDVDTGKRVWRMECEPGQEAQIDYGTHYMGIGDCGRLKKVHMLIVTLSHSRKSYVEAVLSQSSESFLRSLENAFRHFGGVPERLCSDNLKAAVIKADWHDPDLNPKLRDFAAHYDTVILPSRPYTPTDKGKVEAGVR